MKIICPRCFAEYEVQPDVIGQKVECQRCKFQWIAESAPVPTPEMKPCPLCGESILAVAKKCRYCGEYLTNDIVPVHKNKKNRGFYCLLAIFFGQLGVHNFYAEQNSEGFTKLFLTGLTVIFALMHSDLTLIPPVLIFWLTVVDLCYDPNIQIKDRKKVLGCNPDLISILLPLILSVITILILINNKVIMIESNSDSIEQYLRQ